jgi:hypothetical protein
MSKDFVCPLKDKNSDQPNKLISFQKTKQNKLFVSYKRERTREKEKRKSEMSAWNTHPHCCGKSSTNNKVILVHLETRN